MKKSRLKKFDLSVWQIITIGYLTVISLGSFLLCLPVSNRAGVWVPFINALFTATSSTCVTGLIVYDTFTHWNTFGHVVILLMIQIGGVGFMTVITLFSLILRKKISLFERKLIMASAGTDRISGTVALIRKIVIGTAIFEGMGTIILATRFVKDFGWGTGIWYASFHSISAFCNAGFDLMGRFQPFSSLTHYVADPIVSLTIASLIFIGGIGFLVWSDIVSKRFNPKKYTLHTKVALYSSIVLVLGSALLFFLYERNNPLTMKNLTPGGKFIASIFAAISPRTAGFNTISMSGQTDKSSLLTMALMLIGGSSGSTAGGIKITTFVVILIGFVAMARNSDDIQIGKKRLDSFALRHALAIFGSYMITIFASTTILLILEKIPMKDALFETFSAIGTVGLTTGITPSLSVGSKLVLILLMFLGRVGVLTIALAFSENRKRAPIRYGIDRIYVG